MLVWAVFCVKCSCDCTIIIHNWKTFTKGSWITFISKVNQTRGWDYTITKQSMVCLQTIETIAVLDNGIAGKYNIFRKRTILNSWSTAVTRNVWVDISCQFGNTFSNSWFAKQMLQTEVMRCHLRNNYAKRNNYVDRDNHVNINNYEIIMLLEIIVKLLCQ